MTVREQVREAYASEEVVRRTFSDGAGSETAPSAGTDGFDVLNLTDMLFTASPVAAITDYQWIVWMYNGYEWLVLEDSSTLDPSEFDPTASFNQNYYIAGWVRGAIQVISATGADVDFTVRVTP